MIKSKIHVTHWMWLFVLGLVYRLVHQKQSCKVGSFICKKKILRSRIGLKFGKGIFLFFSKLCVTESKRMIDFLSSRKIKGQDWAAKSSAISNTLTKSVNYSTCFVRFSLKDSNLVQHNLNTVKLLFCLTRAFTSCTYHRFLLLSILWHYDLANWNGLREFLPTFPVCFAYADLSEILTQVTHSMKLRWKATFRAVYKSTNFNKNRCDSLTNVDGIPPENCQEKLFPNSFCFQKCL